MYLHFYVFLNFLIISSAKILQRDVCLDTAFSFVTTYLPDSSCYGFYEVDIKNFFQEGINLTCHARCQIKIEYWYHFRNYLEFISLEFNGYNVSATMGCTDYSKARLFINCERWRKNQFSIPRSSDCTEKHADCFKWFGDCFCYCKPGYLMIYGRCLQGHLTLNQSCITTDQCLGLPYASCLGGTCSCIEGYAASSSSNCVLDHQTFTDSIVQTEIKGKSSSTNIGPILGALLGGLLIGVVLTAGFGFVIYKRFRFHIEKRKEPRVVCSMNETYNRTKDDDILPHRPNEPYVHQDKQITNRKVVNVSHLTGTEDLPKYSNIARKQNAMSLTDDVYNHLNEKDKNEDDNNYDHAYAAAATSGHVNDLSEYSNHHGLDCDLSAGMGTDDYSSLEHF